MTGDLKNELLQVFNEAVSPPYTGSFKQWSEAEIELTSKYSIPGKLDLSLSPYLHFPMELLDDDSIEQINLIMATQIGKSMYQYVAIPYLMANKPGQMLLLLHNNDIAKKFGASHVVPVLKACKPTSNLLKYDRFAIKKNEVNFANGHSLTIGGANDGFAHGLTIRYLFCDEVHQFDDGMLQKAVARTTAFAGRRKIFVSSQPDIKGSELERIYNSGRVFEWHWTCPSCSTVQQFVWNKQREDETYCGFIMTEKVYEKDGETLNIAESAKSTVLECEQCRHQVKDTPSNRLLLNNTGKYVCVADNGNKKVVTVNCSQFVNKEMSFDACMTQYLIAKRASRAGNEEGMINFVNQVLGRFYKADPVQDLSQILTQLYDKTIDNEWLVTMGVDFQQNGRLKYYVIRAWHKDGNKSKRLDFGVTRDWNYISELQDKYKIYLPCVGVDTGFNPDGEAYQNCIVAGGKFQVIKNKQGQFQHVGWTPLRGDGTHKPWKHPDGVTRMYSPPSPQDAQFTRDSKYFGIPANVVFFHSDTIQRILANLRDNQTHGVKWMIDSADKDYISQLYAEGFAEIENKKTGIKETKWIVKSDNNHYWDCEKMNLTLAMIFGHFTAADLELSTEKQTETVS